MSPDLPLTSTKTFMHDICGEISALTCKDSPFTKGSLPNPKGLSSPVLANKTLLVQTDRDGVFTCFWL